MLGILAQIRDGVLGAVQLVRNASSAAYKYTSALERASSDPGLPVENPTPSYWMQDPPHPKLLDRQDPLPAEADIVIIGSGITGAAAANTICELHGSDQAQALPKIVIMEARQLCSGATARNGGHIKCAPHLEYARLKKQFGGPTARKIVNLQLRHLDILHELGEQVPEGEVRTVETGDLFLDEAEFAEARKAAEVLKEEMPEVKIQIWVGNAARAKFGVNEHIVGAISYDAGALWPFRLVTGVWHRLCEDFPTLRICTHTSVESVGEGLRGSHPYAVHTSRGQILARHVLHATNGFAGRLVPMLRGRLTGVLGHMTAQRPGNEFPLSHGKTSWSIMYGSGFDYASQRPDREDGRGGDLMLGGAMSRSKDEGLDQFGIWDDGRVDAFPLMHLRGSLATVFEPSWGSGSEMIMAWTGIMGFTGDVLPFVGRLPASVNGLATKATLNGSGEWIAAGFNGEGMVWAWLSGIAVGLMISGKEDENLARGKARPGGRLVDWFPVQECAVNAQRLERANLRNLREWL